MTPKPRKAKKVRATLETMSANGGYPEGANRSMSIVDSVAIENTRRIPITTTTTTVWALATTCEPRTFRLAITRSTRTANGLTQSALSATAALA